MKRNKTVSSIEQYSIRVILLNNQNELLLMKACDPSTTEVDGTYNGAFWFLVGGQVEGDESVTQTVER
ncbi:MAG: NUDIX domain-containing protein [bacterium]|nr:NUDIX domain-containing protein [bacterium]